MPEILSGFAQSQFGHPAFDYKPETAEEHWQQQTPDFTMLTQGWQQLPAQHMSGSIPLDLKFEDEAQGYFTLQHIPAAHIGYPGSDMDTPSSNGYPDHKDPYAMMHTPGLLHPGHTIIPTQMQSPHSSISGASPHQAALASPIASPLDVRPTLSTRNTAPGAIGKHKNSTSGSDEDFDPGEPSRTSGGRGRKRQRIPHTAVERRYRENLNAHLEKLRQTVPTLAMRRPENGGKAEGVKPSKCEILHGAIEYISVQEKESAMRDHRIRELEDENRAMMERLEQMAGWIKAQYQR